MSKIGDLSYREAVKQEEPSIQAGHPESARLTQQQIAKNIATKDLGSMSTEIKSSAAQALVQEAKEKISQMDYLAAFFLFKKAADLGSDEAQHWLLQVKKPGPSELKLIPGAVDIKQGVVLKKLSLVLEQLQKTNKAYSQKEVSKILADLEKGHCNGFSIFYGQLSLDDKESQDTDPAAQYYQFIEKILKWDEVVFEPPLGFSYPRYRAGDKQGLSAEQERRMLFTDEIKQFIQIVRYAHQIFHEADKWSQPVAQQNDLEEKGLLTDIPLGAKGSQFNEVSGILGPDYEVQGVVEHFDIDFGYADFVSSIKVNLFEDNMVLLATPTPYHGKTTAHAASIIFRDGRYYLFDPNDTSLEDNYDRRYSGRSFDSPESLFAHLKSTYVKDKAADAILAVCAITFVKRKDTQNSHGYIKEFKIPIAFSQLNELLNLLGRDLFDRFFIAVTNEGELSSNLVQEIYQKDPHVLRMLPKGFPKLKELRKIDCSKIHLTTDDFCALIPVARGAQIIAHEQDRESLARAFVRFGEFKLAFELAQDYEKGGHGVQQDLKKAQDLYESIKGYPGAKEALQNLNLKDLQSRVEQGEAKALSELAQLYRFGNEGVEKNMARAVELYKKAGELGTNDAYVQIGLMVVYENFNLEPKEIEEILLKIQNQKFQWIIFGEAYKLGKGLLKDLEKARHYYDLLVKNGDSWYEATLKEIDKEIAQSHS